MEILCFTKEQNASYETICIAHTIEVWIIYIYTIRMAISIWISCSLPFFALNDCKKETTLSLWIVHLKKSKESAKTLWKQHNEKNGFNGLKTSYSYLSKL